MHCAVFSHIINRTSIHGWSCGGYYLVMPEWSQPPSFRVFYESKSSFSMLRCRWKLPVVSMHHPICYNALCMFEMGVDEMSESMLNMWISFAGMGLLILAMGLILVSRYKLKGFLSGIVTVLAYLSLIIGAVIILYIVFSGPTA